MLTLFGVVISVYVDDVFIAEPAETINSAFRVFRILRGLLGFQPEDSKEQRPTKTPSLLGAEITITFKWLTARLPDRKRKDLVNELKQCLVNGQLTPAQAAKLRGRLGFIQSLLFGRTGRALMNAFTARQYSKTKGRPHPLNDELKLSLNWWVHALQNAEPRRTLLKPTKPVLVYCDASGSGHIGFVVIYEGIRKFGHTHLPIWIAETAGIYEYELISAIYALRAASLLWQGLPILLRTDNSGAASTLVRGNCTSAMGGILASVF